MFDEMVQGQVTMDDMGQPQTLDDLRKSMGDCRRCGLAEGRTNIVFGDGNPNALLMFIGEGPGRDEDRLGKPFVGAAGQLLDKIIEAGGWTRDEVYIGNIVKCRPPGNRVPTRDEAQACMPWLRRQIELIAPRIIVLLGATALQFTIDPKARITACRGRWIERGRIRIMPTFHPAALLRDPSKKRPVWEDIKLVRDEYRRLAGK